MKRFLFLLLTMCSFTISYSQDAKDLLTSEEKEYSEKTKDDAFLAPMSKLVGKKWYVGPGVYFIFNQNGTGTKVIEGEDNDYSHLIRYIQKIPFSWKRDGIDLYAKYNMMKQSVYQPVESSLSQLSPREKAKVKKDYAEWQTRIRNKEYSDTGKWHNFEIYKLTNDIFISTWGDATCYWVTKKKLDELMARKESAD